jgi:hypothetical protein
MCWSFCVSLWRMDTLRFPALGNLFHSRHSLLWWLALIPVPVAILAIRCSLAPVRLGTESSIGRSFQGR